MTFPVVAALAAAGWAVVFVLIVFLFAGSKDAKAAADQAHAYRCETERVRRERDVLDAELARAHVRHEKAAEAWMSELSTYQEQMLMAGEMLRHQEEGQ